MAFLLLLLDHLAQLREELFEISSARALYEIKVITSSLLMCPCAMIADIVLCDDRVYRCCCCREYAEVRSNR